MNHLPFARLATVDWASVVLAYRQRRVDDMTLADIQRAIEMGWGETPAHLLPADWRERRGPDQERAA